MSSTKHGVEIDRQTFDHYVRDALARLDDKHYLNHHALRNYLVGPNDELPPGGLRQILCDAIRALRPPTAMPNSAEWRRSEYLWLRYVEQHTPASIARALHVSPRQTRRDRQLALDALCAMLWAKRRTKCGSPPSRCAPEPTSYSTESVNEGVEAELLRLGVMRPERPTIVEEALRGAIDAVSELAAGTGLRLEVSLPPSITPTAVHAMVLRHVVVSVLDFAIESRCQRVELTALDTPVGAELTFTVWSSVPSAAVTDNLAGNPEHPLWIARRLIEMQGGTVEIHAGPGNAIIIRLALPAAAVTTVLVVDDNPDAVRLFRRYLGQSMFRVLQANTAQQALILAREGQPDVIILDLMMPLHDGLEVLKHLKADPISRDIPVVVCSVLRERALVLSLGADQFLIKPVTQPALLAALERYSRAPIRRAPQGWPEDIGSSHRPTAHQAG